MRKFLNTNIYKGVTFGDLADVTGVSIFVREVVGISVVLLVVLAAVLMVYKAIRERKNDGGHQSITLRVGAPALT